MLTQSMSQSDFNLLNAASQTKILSELLYDNVLPFWLRHGIDPQGGISNCLTDDGEVVSHDKWLWSQWRGVWVFSKLYNNTNDSKWLEIAKDVYGFAQKHGWNTNAKGWNLRIARDGSVLDGYKSIYCDGFAIYGLTEFFKATNDAQAMDLAKQTADAVMIKLALPHERIPHFPYPIEQGTRVHGLPMIFSLVFWELGQVLGDQRYKDYALKLSTEVFDKFYRPDRDVILERIAADGGEYPSPQGTAVVPGHVIEDMWFQIHIATDRKDIDRIDQACHVIRRHLELGWDDTYGGLLLGVDADGREQVGWEHHDTKLWWPHTEAMYALIRAYAHCREQWCVEWYRRICEYAFGHFPHPKGEWVQKLDRKGKPITTVVALPVKDPFHLPRALILSLEAFKKLATE